LLDSDFAGTERPVNDLQWSSVMIRNKFLALCFAAAALSLATAGVQADAEVKVKKSPAKKGLLILYNGQKFQGDILEIKKMRTSIGEDMPVGSIAVFPGEAWEICEGARFKAPCRIVTGDETALGGVMIRSVRPVGQPAAAGLGTHVQ
jgi:hypothetical protein